MVTIELIKLFYWTLAYSSCQFLSWWLSLRLSGNIARSWFGCHV